MLFVLNLSWTHWLGSFFLFSCIIHMYTMSIMFSLLHTPPFLFCNKQVCCHTPHPFAMVTLDSASALPLLTPDLCTTMQLKGWRAKLHHVSRKLLSFNLSSHFRDLWSISTVNLRPRRWWETHEMPPSPTWWLGTAPQLSTLLLSPGVSAEVGNRRITSKGIMLT